MTDVNLPLDTTRRHGCSAPRAEPAGMPVSDAANELVELLFFAYRDFTGEPDAILCDLGFGRAHHRVLHFITWHPGLRVADLLDILRITKQSLARVLKQLIDEGFVNQEPGRSDRRERLLYPTAAGRRLACRLTEVQAARIASALAGCGPDGERAVRTFLLDMVADADRASVLALVTGMEPAGKGTDDADRNGVGDGPAEEPASSAGGSESPSRVG